MGHINAGMEEALQNVLVDTSVDYDHIIYPWEDNWNWDPAPYARKPLAAEAVDEDDEVIAKVHFEIVVNPDYGEMYEPIWIIDEGTIKVVRVP